MLLSVLGRVSFLVMLVGEFDEDARLEVASFWSFITKAAFFEMYFDFEGFFLVMVGAVGANGFFWPTLLVVPLEELLALPMVVLAVPLAVVLVTLLIIVGDESEATGALGRGFGRMSVVMDLKSESLCLSEECRSGDAEGAKFLLAT